MKTALIVIHQLPRTPETLWLRLLGRGTVQKQAVEELESLPRGNPLRENVLKLVQALVALLEKRQRREQDIDPEDQELIMTLLEMYEELKAEMRQEFKEEGLREGKEEGLREGEQLATRRFVETLLRTRFETVDDELMAKVDAIAQLPSEEFTPLLLHLTRAELLARFQ